MKGIDEKFDCEPGERAAFEVGIKLASLFHQYLGAPVSPENVEKLERSMKAGVMAQPYVIECEVAIDRDEMERELSVYDYCSLSQSMLSARIVVEYEGVSAVGMMAWEESMNYPLFRLTFPGRSTNSTAQM